VNLDELRGVQDRERDKDSLQHLRDSFYEEVGTYIGDLRAERERAAGRADDPFADPEVRRLTEEIQTAEEVAESIYERRMGKVVKTASLAAAGYAADTDGLTTEEADLFEDLVDRIEANQETVLDVLGGEADRESGGRDLAGADAADLDGVDRSSSAAGRPGEAPPQTDEDDAYPDDGSPEGPGKPTDVESTDAGSPGSGSTDADAGDPAAEASSPADDGGDRPAREAAAVAAEEREAAGFDAAAVMGEDDRVTLRITEDVGEIVGVDGTAYDLAVDDVVTLPEENAMPLVEKDAATRLD